MGKIFTFLLLGVMLVNTVSAQKNLRILLVHDNDKAPTATDSIRHAINSAGYEFTDYDAVTNGAPALEMLNPYELVIWSNGTDASTRFWDKSDPGNIKANPGLLSYLNAGGMLWVEGIDFMYDAFGGAPDTFKTGSFVYDYLGVEIYAGQGHVDDKGSYDGLPLMLVVPNNGICSTDTVNWRWSTMWYADGMKPTTKAKPVYRMGPDDYILSQYYSGIYNENDSAKILSFFIRGDGYKTAELGKKVTGEVLDYFNQFSAGASVSVSSLEITSASGFTISSNNGTLQMGINVLPENATNKTVTWSITEGSVEATITQDGLLTASGLDNGNGKVVVVATANDGTGIKDEEEITITNQTLGTGYKILLVNGDIRDKTKYIPVENALINGSFNYKLYDVVATGKIPDSKYLENFNFVLWYNGRDGVNLKFWDKSNPENIQCNAPLKEFADNGGIVWAQGRDMFYSIYGSKYTTKNAAGDSLIAAFNAGNFIYDYLGVSGFVAQSYTNDNKKGVSQFDLTEENKITTLDPIKSIYASMQYVDILDVTENATPLYYLGPETYDFSLFYSMVHNVKGKAQFITSSFDPSTINTQPNIDLLVKEVLDYFIDLHTGVEIVGANNFNLNIYPNPASGNMFVKLTSDRAELLNVRIVDISGREVLVDKIYSIAGEKTHKLDISKLNTGIYSIVVNSEGQSSNKRLVIVR